MAFLDRLESKLGRFAIPHLLSYVAAGQAVVWLATLLRPELPLWLAFDPALIQAGQAWRALTWVLIIPERGPFFAFFAIYMLWWMGQALEQAWGSFRFNAFYLSGVLACFLLAWTVPGLPLVPHWLHLSLFLAFAILFPDFEVLLLFVLPVKVKWLAWLNLAFLILQAWAGGWRTQMLIAASLANLLLFFGPALLRRLRRDVDTTRARAVFAQAEEELGKLPTKRCRECEAGPDKADLRLCLCEACGEDGRFYCVEHLSGHLKKP